MLKIYCFGPPRIEIDGTPVEIQRRKAIALLIYLAVNSQPHSRDALATLFFPEADQRRARAYLRRDLAALNTGLPGKWLDADRDLVELQAGRNIWLDVKQFRHCLTTCLSHQHSPDEACTDCLSLLTEAAALYSDHFLAGFTLRDNPEFDDWQFFQTESLRQELATVLERLVRGLNAQANYEVAIPLTRRWLALDPLHEPAQQALIQLYHQAGQSSAALRQYEIYAELLEAELGLPPGEETSTLYEAIKANRTLGPFLKKAATPQSQAAEGIPAAHASAPRYNLPIQPTPFIGREKEVAEISRLLQDEVGCRLLTLVGPGGMGKSRLALQAAAESLEAFADGVTFIPLASVGAVDNLIPTLANSFNLSFMGGSDSQTQLVDYLREKQCLLVLDNFEHLIDGAGLLSDILTEAAAVKILVTSRERLRLQVEWTFDVQGLDFPDKETVAPDEPYAAVTLFRQRARRVQAGFEPTLKDSADIARICRLVQGMPLAIELAATWVKMLSCGEIAAEIEESLDFLAAELQDVPERQRSIRAVFQHSWNITPETEREAFEKLSVFRGGFSREAAKQVAGASLLTLSSLADKSLIRRDTTGRYQIHELLRQYGADKLSQKAEALAEVQRRHAIYFASLMRNHQDSYYSGQRERTTEAINQEIDNVRVTWQWAVEHKDYDTFGQCAMSLYFFYETQGWYREGEAAFRTAAAALQDTVHKDGGWDLELRSNFRTILTSLGWFYFRLARYKETRDLLQKSLPMYRAVQDKEGLWMATELSANVAYSLGQYEEARQFIDQNLQSFQADGTEWPWATGQSLTNLGRVYTALGDYDSARELLENGLSILKQIGDGLGTILALHTLGRLYHGLGHLAQAENAYRECLALGRANELPLGEAVALNDLGDLTYQQGLFEKAKEHYQYSLKIYREIGDRRGRALALNNLGMVDTALGDYEAAGQRYQQSLDICEQTRNRRGLALTLNYLSTLARIQEDYGRAQALNQESLAHCREIGYTKGIALALQRSGDLALDLADYPEAERLYRKSLEICGEINFQEGRIDGHLGLGQIARLRGETQTARHYFHQALADVSALQTIPKMLDALVSLAALLSIEGEAEKALEIVALAEQHPACTRQTQEKAIQLLQELVTELPDEVIAAARLAGSKRAIEEVIREMVA